MTTAREQAPAPEQRDRQAPASGAGPSAPRAVGQVLALQRAAGNRAVAAAVQRSRTTPPGVVRPEVAGPGVAGPGVAGPGVAEPVPAAAAAPVVQRTGLLDDIADAAGGVRDTILRSVRDRARGFPGYSLLAVVLGKDPITDAPVERTGAALINGFLDIVPGSDRIRRPLEESRAVERAGAWLDQEVPKLGLTFDYVKGLVDRVLATLDASDLLDIPGAIARVMRVFSEPLQRLRSFASGAVRTLMEFIVEGAMALAGGAGGQVMGIIRRAGGAFDRIVADPMGFLANLVAAAKGGFLAFGANIGTHLRNGLISWLTGALGGVLRIPARLDLPGVLGMAMDFLGLTWQRVRGRLTRLIPEPVLNRLEQGAGLVADLHRRGLAAITDRIAELTGGIVDTVLGGIREWVTNNVVTQAITRIVSMFNPAGAIVQAAIAIYNTVQFFIERGRQIAALGEAIFDSIEAIASGSIGGAVQRVEQALGRAVPVLLGFLSRLLGIGDIATPVRNIMQRVHTVIDGAIDRVLGWVGGIGRRAAAALGLGRGAGAAAGDRSLSAAVREGEQLLRRPGATPESVRGELGGLRQRHGLRSAGMVAGAAAGTFKIHVQRNRAETPPVPLGTDVRALVERARQLVGQRFIVRSTGRNATVLSADLHERPGVRHGFVVLRYDVQRTIGGTSRTNEPRVTFEVSRFLDNVANGGPDLVPGGGTAGQTKYTLDGRLLRDEYRADIRGWFYGSGYQRHRGALEREARHADGPTFTCPGWSRSRDPARRGPHRANVAGSQVDHRGSVAQHWEDVGHRCSHQERVRWNEDISNLQLLCGPCNSEKGSADDQGRRARFRTEVQLPGFSGPDGES
ncbi:phage tail protein [Nocardioides sp. SYSU DS0651]|uniref:phage tail protein n=1 Tax=Nocardioides sp. SYSU DS0651 TaxID=3415955 RepID=UPI003F4BCA8D